MSRIRSIDINYKDELITVYFSSHPLFSLLSQNTKEFFIDKSVALSSRNDKLRDFLAFRKVIYQDIENEKNASRRFLSEAAMNYLFASSLGLAYVVLLLLVVFYSVTVAGTILDHFEKQIIRGLSLVQLLLVSLYTIIWGVNIAPLTREKIKTKELLKAGGT